jgi:pyruvate formate lyase activating enzyme
MSEYPALFWDAEGDGAARCRLCPHGCLIPPDGAGVCGVRTNAGGQLYAASYGRASALALDPIEKKPLCRFHPGKRILSLGSYGCNFRCPFCQNSEISIEYDMGGARAISPEQLAALAKKTVSEGNIGVAYTYNEPLIGFEFVYDCAVLIRKAGLRNILVTNGYIRREPLEALLPYTDAMNIDLKGFTEDFYRKLGGGLAAVRETIELARRRCHVEITALVIPGENEDDIIELASYLASLSPDIPLHLSRFFPRYRYADRQQAPRETMYRLGEAAKKHLKYVYLGNL